MREPLRDIERLRHIQDAIDKLLSNKEQYSYEQVLENSVAYYGFVKLVEIIGEATYKLTKEYKSTHPAVPWSMMERMRHILVHDYYNISPQHLWDTIQYDIPDLKPMIDALVKDWEEDSN